MYIIVGVVLKFLGASENISATMQAFAIITKVIFWCFLNT